MSMLALEKEKNYFIREFSQAQEDLKLKREKEEQAKKEKERAKKLVRFLVLSHLMQFISQIAWAGQEDKESYNRGHPIFVPHAQRQRQGQR